MNINKTKLKNLVTHLEDEGALDIETLAAKLMLHIDNHKGIQTYVEAAAKELDDPSVVTRFTDGLPNESEPEKPKKDAAKKKAGKNAKGASEGQTVSEPKEEGASDKQASDEEELPFEEKEHVYRDSSGQAHKLQLKKILPRKVIYVDVPANEIVSIILAGEMQTVDLTAIMEDPEGRSKIGNNEYPHKVLLILAEAARA